MRKKGVDIYDDQIESYAKSDVNELESFSRVIKEEAKKQDIPVESDIKTLKDQVGNDLRKNIPPQLFAVVSGIIDVIGKLEEEDLNEG
ncbi:hypothetical protein [Fusibacter sp. JL216-2]|uniref:hypothetical protein n=1 Tax=Fusibacter sp. JL216-2 TaxID=3071453 RepID=UPI003D32FD6F